MKRRLFTLLLAALIFISASIINTDVEAAGKSAVKLSNKGIGKSFKTIPQLCKGTNNIIMTKRGVYICYTAEKTKKYTLTFSSLGNAKTLDTDIRTAVNAKCIKDLKRKPTETVALCGSKYVKEYRYTGYMKTRTVTFKMKKGETVYVYLSYGKVLNKNKNVSCKIKLR